MCTDSEPRRYGSSQPFDRRGGEESPRRRDDIYSQRVPAGRRTYFFDVKATKSGADFFITITESKRVDEHRYEKHKLFLYKEDFAKFLRGLNDVIQHIREECLPDYEFIGLPEMVMPSAEEAESEEPY